jgi:hypothetical protein
MTYKYEIIDCDGNIVDIVSANNERQALCLYLMKHDELTDVMLWKSTFDNKWRCAKYDNEDEYFRARKQNVN